MNFGMLLIMTLTKLVRGPGGGEDSVFGLDICAAWSWVAFALLILSAIVITLLAAKIANKQYLEK